MTVVKWTFFGHNKIRYLINNENKQIKLLHLKNFTIVLYVRRNNIYF